MENFAHELGEMHIGTYCVYMEHLVLLSTKHLSE